MKKKHHKKAGSKATRSASRDFINVQLGTEMPTSKEYVTKWENMFLQPNTSFVRIINPPKVRP